jgi:hypothetical protein
MARITVDQEQWSDIVLIFMLDTLQKKKQLESTSEEYKVFMYEIGNTIRPRLVKAFLNMDVDVRVLYRLIRDAFSPQGGRTTIDITKILTKFGKKED